MITLLPNLDNQTAWISPYQSRKFLPTFTHYLVVITSMATNEEYIVIGQTPIDNERLTKLIIGTATSDATRGKIPITETGMHTYRIYGQNSTTNLDPTNVTHVVGEVEQGICIIEGTKAWDIPSINVPDNVVYYE